MSNIDSRLVNYQEKLIHEYDSISSILNKHASESNKVANAVNAISDIYATKINTLEPQIMVYGIYNAGKSSIINALIREEKAKVADIPTTDSVDFYEWNGYQIADTPGVGAPIKHEEVTNNHLKKADVVLFVMSTSGSFEYGQNYSRMKNIIDSGKRVLIILNDKEGILGTEEGEKNLTVIKSKIIQNMKQVGIENSISDIQDKYQIITVNAADAKLAIEEADEDLFQESKMPELEKAIKRELKKANSFVVLKNALANVEKELKDITMELQKGETSEELKDLNQILAVIRERKRELREVMQSFISVKTKQLSAKLPIQIWDIKEDSEKVDNTIKESIDGVTSLVQRKLNDEFLNINDDIKTETKDFIKKLEKIRINIDTKIHVDKPTGGNVAVTESGLETLDKLIQTGKNLYDILKDIPIINQDPGQFPFPKRPLPFPTDPSPIPGGPFIPTTIPTGPVAGQVAEKVAPLVIKALPSTLAKSAGAAVPYIGPIITGISIIYDLLKDNEGNIQDQIDAANERERLRLQAEEQAKQTLRQNCEFMAEDLKDDLILSVNETIRDTLGEVEKTFTSQIATSKEGAQNLTDDINMISNVINNLNRVRVELEA